MATYNAVNVRTGAAELPKSFTPGRIDEIWVYTGTVALASGDTIIGPTIPPEAYLIDLATDCGALGGSAAFSVGYTGTPAAFIAAGANNAVAGGMARLGVGGTMGYHPGTPTQIVITMTGAAATAGSIRMMVSYTNNP